MELLKTSVKALAIIVLLLCTKIGFAQNEAKQIAAFKASYINEKAGEYGKAVGQLQNVYDEKSYEINLRMGWLHYLSSSLSESVTYYQKAVSLMPYAVEARLGLIYPLTAQAKWDDILAQYKEILKIDVNNTTANYKIGLIYYTRKDYQSAYKHFEKVVNLYPFGYDALIMFAWSNFQLGKFKEAKILFNKVLLYSPTDTSALEGLSLIK